MQQFEDTRILVVGGAGFVGSNLVNELLHCSPREVVIVDNFLSAVRQNVPDDSRVHLIEGSITDDDVLGGLDPDLDYVFHLATFHGNQNSVGDPLADHQNNTLTTLKLYEHIKRFARLKKVVYASAGCTVAEKTFDKAEATDEEAPVSLYLDTPYQISKIIGEYYSNYYWMRDGLPVVKARFQNVYGPGEILGAGRWRGTVATIWRNVIPSFIYRALKRSPLTVENHGVATRDFIYVADTVRGLMRCATDGAAGAVYNLASGVETSILDLARTINELTENPMPIDFQPMRTWDRSGKRFGNTAKATRELGFATVVGLRQGLERTITWAREQMRLIDTCIAAHSQHTQNLAEQLLRDVKAA